MSLRKIHINRGDHVARSALRATLLSTTGLDPFAIAPNFDKRIKKRLLGSIYSTAVEMTETKLRCYFS